MTSLGLTARRMGSPLAMRRRLSRSWKCIECGRPATNSFFCDDCPAHRPRGRRARRRDSRAAFALAPLGLARA
jgi:hypothetical protein